MRRLFFGGDDVDFNLLEACRFEPAMQVAFREAEPTITIKIAGLLELVGEQIENQNLSVRLQEFGGGGKGHGGIFRMM